MVPSTSETWNQEIKKVPRPRCWRKKKYILGGQEHLGPKRRCKQFKKTVQNLVPSTSKPWNQGTKKVPRPICWMSKGGSIYNASHWSWHQGIQMGTTKKMKKFTCII
jgi:hypothetical protein